MDAELKYKVFYYGRHQYFQTMHLYAVEGFNKFPNDVVFKLFSGYALVLLGRHQEAIRELDSLLIVKDINIGVTIAMIYAHKHCQTVDKETLSLLEEKLKSERKSSEGLSLYYAAVFLFFQSRIDKAREYLSRFLKQNNDSVEGLCLKGWIDLASDQKSNLKTALSSFKIALEKDRKNVTALLGLVKIREIEKNYTEGLTLLNQVINKNLSSVLPLIEKAKLQLCTQEFDQAFETCNRVLNQDNSSIDAHKIKIIITLCRDGSVNESAIHLKQLMTEVEKVESKNGLVYFRIAQLFGSLACRHHLILQETLRFAEKAAQLEPANAEYMAGLGFQNLLLGNLKDASRCFKNTNKLDDSSIVGLTGLTLCQLLGETMTEQIKQQVDFLKEVQGDEPSTELLLMMGKLAVSADRADQALRHAAEVQLSRVETMPYGIQFLQLLNVDILMEIVKENMNWALRSSNSAQFYRNSLVVLEAVCKACPGMGLPRLELARVHFLLDNLTEAKDVLTHILNSIEINIADAHVLMAQINLKQKNYTLAARSLENSLSHNFQIREHPLYHLVAAMVHKQNGSIVDVVKSLKTAMASPTYHGKVIKEEGALALSLADKASICLELVTAFSETGQVAEANDLIKSTLQQFKGTSEEGRVVVANAELSVCRGNTKAAIDELERIQPGESYYVLARRALADIYLKHLHDRVMFVQCYQDLVKLAPSRVAYEMLGDAYTSIQDPDGAISAYEEALKFEENNSELICKMGKSLVKTHYYTKAINYYKEAVKNNQDPFLIYDMAQLYFKLGQLDNAERILLKHANDRKTDPSDIRLLTLTTKLLQLLAKVRDKSGSLTDSLAALKDSKENHCKMDKRTLSQSDTHKAIVVEICCDTAQLLTRLRDFNGAIKVFKEALNYRPNDSKVLVGLARLYIQINNIEECQQTCQHLLSTDADSEPAAIMLADIAFRKMDLDTSARHLKQLLTRQPLYWTALARLIEVSRRVGNLEDSLPFIKEAEKRCPRANQEAGLFYCKGLYDSYRGEPQLALHNFNLARDDAEWGESATHNMIEICLNPEQDTMGGEDFYYDMVDNEISDSRENALKTAKRLLMQAKPRKGTEEEITHRLLENFWLLATRQKGNIEKALTDLIEITSDDYYKEHVGIALGVATAFMLQKQVQKARNYLKRMVKTQWRFEDAEYLERSWLLLTDIHIQAGKTDVAADLIQRVLEHNKSCYKAYEYAGFISEKEQLYKEAAFQYQHAWRLSAQSNPAVGFKLAFNHMKAKNYADAIDTCHAVLKINPNYPRIRKEILEKSRNHLRTSKATLINGNEIAKQIQSELACDIEKWASVSRRKPMLVAILVGDDPASETYVSHKLKVAKKVGVSSKAEHYPSSYEESQLLLRINELNNDDSVDGILVQLPLPKGINEKLICRSIDPTKDVDGFSAVNMGKLAIGREALAPCTPLGVIELIKRSAIQTRGKNAVVIGRSKNVGLPSALLLHSSPNDATTTICHGKTPKEELRKACQAADIVVVATGIPRLLTADMVKPGATVIDVGITRVVDPATGKNRLVGDVDFQNVQDVAGAITPVPGGVGPMTVTMLMANTFLAAKWRTSTTQQ